MVAPHTSSPQGDLPAVAARKKELRQHCMATLKARDEALDSGILTHLHTLLYPQLPAVVAGVWPLPHEVNLCPLCHILVDAGATMVLPETPPRGQPLIFRRWTPDTPMMQGRFGTEFPAGPVLQPAIILVPLLGFDRTGNRLGYGGGYYDRTLAGLPDALSIGYAPSCQELDSLPTGPYDRPLSCIVTEKEILRFD